jgi:hypothetical protein
MTGYESKRAAAQAKTIDQVNWADHEPNGVTQPASQAYAVIQMQVGDVRTSCYLTQEQLHNATDPWLLMELSAKRCIRYLKENTND